MNDRIAQLTIGSLLHDIGKLLYRYDDGRNHSQSGYDYLKEKKLISDTDILECVHYHHGAALSRANVKPDAICYATYIADNIAAFSQRREKDSGDGGFVRDAASESIFNVLNGNSQQFNYPKGVLSENAILYPTDKKIAYDEKFYGDILENINDSLRGIYFAPTYINSLLSILESNLSFIPSSTNAAEAADISLFDHLKLTAALAVCIEQYLQEKGIDDYKRELFDNAKSFYSEDVFLLYSIDVSGIQDFIYTVSDSGSGALKGLRARSFYLEILMESIIDHLLETNALSRTNLLYSGGGRAYIILANTDIAKANIAHFEAGVNNWFINTFKTALYIAGGYCAFCANALKNESDGSYKAIFETVAERISKNKLSRYSAAELIELNKPIGDTERECSVCRRADNLIGELCSVCSSLRDLSDSVIKPDAFFTILNEKPKCTNIVLPFNQYLATDDSATLVERMKSDSSYVRSYSKNRAYTGCDMATRLFVGDYASSNSFEALAAQAKGIERIAVLRADVDNLGKAFISGFERENGDNRFVTLSRTATLSRKLSMFFKLHINNLLQNGTYMIGEGGARGRNAAIVYSGGDDVFVVGAWDDIIGFAVDLHNSFKKFTQGTLTVSAGVGIFPRKFPIVAMAREAGALEEESKHRDGKNAITLFDKTLSFDWDTFIDDVLGEKLALLKSFFANQSERGTTMLYNMLTLMRERTNGDRLNLARFAYLTARLEPKGEDALAEEIAAYRNFASKMYDWVQKEDDVKTLCAAIYIYVYLNRTKGGKDHD